MLPNKFSKNKETHTKRKGKVMLQTIFNSYFLVNFKSNVIIKWGTEIEMRAMQHHFIYLDLSIITFDELTQTMKSSLEFYTNNKETY